MPCLCIASCKVTTAWTRRRRLAHTDLPKLRQDTRARAQSAGKAQWKAPRGACHSELDSELRAVEATRTTSITHLAHATQAQSTLVVIYVLGIVCS